ncbi:hypothetical protein BCR35DRAFT_99375 [Leucosporidium creatinivorum]|uniref:Uncharacterized protein n=1 Tax=Leucosporidium creatinivorum TaxID=106004 RepID=A0A1Y2F4R4_9BASI|nr:hypothetical protein BCR35DRAFT_99375 [Leucosporidium creatinivorum]
MRAPSLLDQAQPSCNCRRGGKCSCCTVLSRAVKAEAPSTPALSESPSSPAGSSTKGETPLPLPELTMPPQPAPHFYYPATSAPFNPYASPQQTPQGYFPLASTSHIPNGFIPQQNPFGSTTPVGTPPISGFPPSAPPTPSYTSPAFPLQSAFPSPFMGPSSYFPNMNLYTSSQGSSACFCGDSCTCAGCPQHDPLGYKRNASMAMPGVLGGISCRCDEGKEQVPGAIKSCCGGALGQLQAAQQAGLSMDELMRMTVQGCQMNLPPMQWPQQQQQQQQQPMPYQQQPMGGELGFTPALSMMGGGGLPPLSQLWGSNAGAAQATAMLMGNYNQEPEQKPRVSQLFGVASSAL